MWKEAFFLSAGFVAAWRRGKKCKWGSSLSLSSAAWRRRQQRLGPQTEFKTLRAVISTGRGEKGEGAGGGAAAGHTTAGGKQSASHKHYSGLLFLL